MEIYDHIQADAIEPGDLIFHSMDYIEVKETLDETDTIVVKGYSHESGDSVVYFMLADVVVSLWRW